MINDQSYHFFQSLSVIGHCASVSQFMQTPKYVIVLPPYLPVKTHDGLQKWIAGRGKWLIKIMYSRERESNNAVRKIQIKLKWIHRKKMTRGILLLVQVKKL